MTISREHLPISPAVAGVVRVPVVRARTSSALGSSRSPGAGTTRTSCPARVGAAALLCLAAGLAGCEPVVQGNGVYYQEQRTGLGGFTGIAIDHGIEALVTAGASSPSVVVSGDSNVVPHLETEVRSEGQRQVLHVWVSTNYTGTIPPRATIALPALELAALDHGARLDARELGAGALALSADQGSVAFLSGSSGVSAQGLTLTLANGATVDATGFPVSGPTAVVLSGGTVARLRADGPVSGTVGASSRLDDLAGIGSCAAVILDASSQLACH